MTCLFLSCKYWSFSPNPSKVILIAYLKPQFTALGPESHIGCMRPTCGALAEQDVHGVEGLFARAAVEAEARCTARLHLQLAVPAPVRARFRVQGLIQRAFRFEMAGMNQSLVAQNRSNMPMEPSCRSTTDGPHTKAPFANCGGTTVFC